jgi:hypothetical protein
MRATPADVTADDETMRIVAQPETPAPLSRLAVRRHDPRHRQEPGAVVPLAGICAGGGEQSPSLPRLHIFQCISTTLNQVNLWTTCSAGPVRGLQGGLRSGPRARRQYQRRGAPRLRRFPAVVSGTTWGHALTAPADNDGGPADFESSAEVRFHAATMDVALLALAVSVGSGAGWQAPDRGRPACRSGRAS